MKKLMKNMVSRKISGMTLIEVIVAMAVMAVAATMLILGAVSVINNTKTARTVVKTVNEQAPQVENMAVTAPYETGMALKFEYKACTGTVVVDKYQAPPPVSMSESDMKSGNLKYFTPVTEPPVTK